MRIVFMGTPDFAEASLKKLIDERFDVVGVFTQPDKPQNRGMKLVPPPVKVLAASAGIPVYQPEKMRTGEAMDILRELKPDILAVVAYGKILPKEMLDLPKFGAVNVHGSLLPKYRGAAPIQWSVINGDKKTGVTSMLMDAGLDTGDILLTSETEIGEDETAGELFDRLADLCPALLLKTLEGLKRGGITPVKQNHEEATYVSVLSKDMAVLDWNEPAATIHNKVRGLNPWPVAKTGFEGKLLKIFSGKPAETKKALAAGTLYATDGCLYVVCGSGTVYEIKELQLEGAKRMNAADFLRGHPVNRPIILALRES